MRHNAAIGPNVVDPARKEPVTTAAPSCRPIVVIPARLGASRLPGKPLADIQGQPMIVHVLRRAEAAAVGPVVVACAEREIAEAIERAGGWAVLTRPDHPTGSDRVHEAVELVDPEGQHDVVVNLQGDVPVIEPSAIQTALAALAETDVDIATLVAPLRDAAMLDDPGTVKAAVGFAAGQRIARALYFSRLPIPFGPGPRYHHFGLYVYRRAALARFVALPPGVLEQRESLEQLRALEAGMRIAAALVDTIPFEVNTPADLARARELLAGSGAASGRP
jgi:3-deoxy-manno-octulosonate cytidylyltransferase (CMP-KDO synthetase)